MNTLTSTPSTIPHSPSTVKDYLTLLKPGVMSLVVFSGAIGLFLAPGHLHPLQSLIAILCIAIGSGAGGAINMWYDADIDAVMRRTKERPIPAGRIQPDDALSFGLFLAVLSVVLMTLATNWLAGGLLAFAIFFYAVIYTMILKRSTPQNIVIGGAAGAFPPMIGWAAVSGDVTLMPLLLFAIIFLWTPPHFWALALYRCGDYEKANVPMLPVTNGLVSTKKHILFYSYLLALVTLAPTLLGLAGFLYGACALLLGVKFIIMAHRVYRSEEEKPAKALFGYSILYLFLLFASLPVDRIIAAI